ncbi:MAG TPA: lactate racemase domain-containing protein [Gemmatales bacterium]|nr:lactate racemase domain-containing protein [Gemmatales bacterium]HMP58306.1 lactate racemase domain-containing protein [Gemmatales bacterium]
MLATAPVSDHLASLAFVPVRQRIDQPQIADVAAHVRSRLRASRLKSDLTPGARIAVAVGSRGIARLEEIVRATLATLQELGAAPFVVAAMGSHGGATPAGQRELLASYGISEERLGVPVRTDMEVVELGRNSWDEPVWWDRNAFGADGVICVARIKSHTDFTGPMESGIAKMLVIGLGKREGAATHHRYGLRGLRDMIPASLEVVLAKSRFLLGLAIVENARDEPAFIETVDFEELLTTEPRLLEQARRLAGRLPFDRLDLLVVGELGKNYSGTGMDVHVLGRYLVETQPETPRPAITRIVVLDLAAESHGNAVGLGLADLTTARLLAQRDEQKTLTNYLTSCFLLRAKTPIALPTDRDAIAMGVQTCWQPRNELLRAAIIPNTLELQELWVTPALADPQHPGLEILGPPAPLPFTPDGWLNQEALFPQSTRGKRNRGQALGAGPSPRG